MSIEDLISQAERENRLVRFMPRTRRPAKRRAFLSRVADQELRDPNNAGSILGGAGYMEAALARWVLGDPIYKGFIKLLKPPPVENVWEIRVVEPTPAWRMFVRFAAPDTIIVSRAHTRGHLNKRGSKAWADAMRECDACWREIFGDAAPFVCGERSVGYVTENCDDFKV